MKEKILAALKAKYKSLGFSDKAIESVLAYLETTVTAEDQIDGAVNGVEALLKAFQGEIDSRVTSAVQKATKKDDGNPSGGDPKKDEPKEDVPAWAKTLLEKVQALETGNSVNTRKQALEAKLKDVSPTVKDKILKDFNRMTFATDEDFNTYLTETETDVQALEQSAADKGLGQQSQPYTAGTPKTEKAIDADIAAWASAGKETKK